MILMKHFIHWECLVFDRPHLSIKFWITPQNKLNELSNSSKKIFYVKLISIHLV
jgi:hypothetical protein